MAADQSLSKKSYYLPNPSHWPIFASIGIFSTLVGGANWIHGNRIGPYLLLIGFLVLIFMFFGWFSTVIHESIQGHYNKQVDRSFRWGMTWFIVSEVFFFGAFFGALFYARLVILPVLAGTFGTQASEMTNLILWPNFTYLWPMLHAPDPNIFPAIESVIAPWGIPALNTLILLSSGGTVTWAHWALIKNRRHQLIIAMAFTVLLGMLFLFMQAHEYIDAYTEKALTLKSGMYGTTFFMLTGFHGLHVTLGTIMLLVILIRCVKGHFDPHHHFAFEAVSWYWHFVDVVWLALFIFVYWL